MYLGFLQLRKANDLDRFVTKYYFGTIHILRQQNDRVGGSENGIYC